jgi:hypothetical protein
MTAKFLSALGLLAALGGASGAHASQSATVQSVGRAEIGESASIQILQDLTFNALLPPTVAAVASPSSAANIQLSGKPGDAVSVAVPSTFRMTRTGGEETLTVITTGLDRMVLGGALRANGALSVDVGGRVVFSGEAVPAGAYRGLLVVMAQYN